MGNSALSAVTKSRRVMASTSADRGRQTRTMLEARAPMVFLRATVSSVRIGHVPVTANPARITASRNVSASARRTVGTIALSLLEGVADGDWKAGVRLLSEAAHRLAH